jgi:hypothetical protein
VFQPVEVSPQVGGSARLVVSVASLEGDDHGEAYTAILRGVRLSHENQDVAGAEAFLSAEGNMCGAAMRGVTALPWSETPLRLNGTCRNLGDLISPNPLWRVRATTGSRGDEAVAEEVRSRTAA